MRKKIIIAISSLILIGLYILFFKAAIITEKSMNVCLHINDEDYNIRNDAIALHKSLIVADLHSDVLLWDRNINKQNNHGHTDIRRLQKGNFTLQVFDAVIKVPKGINYESNTGDTDIISTLAIANRWPINTWSSLCERALYQSKKLYEAAKKSNGELKVITNSVALKNLLKDRKNNKKLLGGILSIEGLHALEGKIENLQRLFDAGYRMMGPVHFFDNQVGGSSAGVEQYGLTDFGKEVIIKMNQMNITVDIAHASPKLIDDILTLTTRPVVVSHTGIKGTYDSPRNLSDTHMRQIAEGGGLIGIGFWDEAVGGPEVENIVKAMKYAIDLVSADHLALGSDWDGGTTTYFDAAHVSILTQAMIDANINVVDIRKIMGENQINFFLKNLP